MNFIFAILILNSVPALAAIDKDLDPRLAKADVQACVDTAKKYLYAGEVDSDEKQLNLIGACRDVEPSALKTIADSMPSWQVARAETLLPVIKAARGRGVGTCYSAAISRLRSQEYDTSEKVQAILKKCE